MKAMTTESFFQNPIYIMEEFHYRIKDLSKKFNCENDKVDDILNSLPRPIVKFKDDKCKFSYVGVMILNDKVFYFYPKYLQNYNLENSGDLDKLNKKFKKVLKVIEKDKRTNKNSFNDNLFYDDSSNVLTLIMYLVKDYFNYGLYENTKNIIEINGNGEILWEKTINNEYPLISNNRPYYLELLSRRKINDSNNYFRQLHEIILSECFSILKGSRLDYFFDILSIPKLTNVKIEDFDEQNHILQMLDMEMNVQFNTHKLELLNAMKEFISQKTSSRLFEGFAYYGTSTFYGVWERVCQKVFNNMIHDDLNDLPIDLNENFMEYLSSFDDKDTEFESEHLDYLIEHPKWNLKGMIPTSVDKYRPDLITIYKNNFLIFDAKYYYIKKDDKSITGQPGLESITKQYLYELSFKKFIEAHNLNVYNSFLFPSDEKFQDGEYNSINGYVELNLLNNLNLENIKTIFISAEEMFDCYLSSTAEDDKEWREKLFEKIIQ